MTQREWFVSICHFYAGLHSTGEQDYWEVLSNEASDVISHEDSFRSDPSRWSSCDNGYYVLTNLSNQNKILMINRLGKFVDSSETRNKDGQLVEVWLPAGRNRRFRGD